MLTYPVMVAGWAAADLGTLAMMWRALRASRWRRSLRAALVLLVVGQLAYLVSTLFGSAPDAVPLPGQAFAYAWHLMVVPATLTAWAAVGVFLACRRVARWAITRPPPTSAPVADGRDSRRPETDEPRPTRRQLLGTVVALAPPFATTAITAVGVAGLHRFTTRRLTVEVPGLPAGLDGFSIAHVTDLHIGRFLPDGMPERVADAVNALGADVIAFTGDLNDLTAPGMRAGIDFVRRLSAPLGTYLVEGNHDVMPDADRFEKAMLDAGINLLLDDTCTLAPRGPVGPKVQLLGITWGELRTGRDLGRSEADTRFRVYGDAACRASVERVAARREPGAFPILLAHHPHAFDHAAALGLPLTLAGHTHGGQLMLTDRVGVGPLRYRYWSGLYRQRSSSLLVGNGVGNWFPLRIGAPQEVVLVTLRGGTTGAGHA